MTSEEAYNECLKQNKNIPELESFIINEAKWSFFYARDIIKKRWEKGENVISQNTEYSYRYSLEIVKKQWLKGEESINKNSEYAYYYVCNIVKKPYEKFHNIILCSAYRNDYIDFLKNKKYNMNKISEWLI